MLTGPKTPQRLAQLMKLPLRYYVAFSRLSSMLKMIRDHLVSFSEYPSATGSR